MNVLILNWRDPKNPLAGGAEAVTLEHAKGWMKKGHSVSWFTSAFTGCFSEEIIDGVKIIRRGSALGVYLIAPLYVIKHRKTIDIIIDEVHGIPFITTLFLNIPRIVFIHEIAGEIWDFMFSLPKNIIGKYLEKLYFRLYRHCIFWTDAESTVNELMINGIPKTQCIAIPCPIIGYKFPSLNSVLKEKNPTFIFVSRVVRMKGIEEVIKAFSLINRIVPQSALWIIGGGEETYIRELKKSIHEYSIEEHVRFFGVVTDKEKFSLMARAHILLHASVKEGWGLVVLEAARVGTPAVVYNVPGLKNVVKNGKTGVVISKNLPGNLAEEVLLLYRDQKRYSVYKKNGIAWAKSITWAKAIEASEKLLYQVTKQS